MSKGPFTLLIDHIPGETRVALLNDEILINIHIDRDDARPENSPCHIGDIYKGRIVNIVPSLQAAFVDIGQNQNAFLPVTATYSDDIIKAFHLGQAVLVQVKQPPKGDKGAVLSCKIDLNADDCVLTPHRLGVNVSRKFKDPAKRDLFKAALKNLLPQDCGLIVRTSAETHDPTLITEQAEALLKRWQSLSTNPEKAPCLLESTYDFLSDIWGQYQHLGFERICVEGLSAFQKMQELAPQTVIHDRPALLFEEEGVNAQIEDALEPMVGLSDGGNIIIEETAALTAVDVNMAERTDGHGADENKLLTNLAALDALSAQIKLRNLSGQIFIDFIALKNKSHKMKLEQAALAKLKDQRTHFHGLTRLGLGEVSRSRVGYGLSELHHGSAAPYYALLRQLAKGTLCRTLSLGTELYKFWTERPPKWLFNRLGFDILAKEDKTLPPTTFRLEDQ